MKTYIGTKIIQAKRMTRGEAEQLLGRQLSDDTTTKMSEGYLVLYGNGYRAWSPAAAFDEAYRETSGLPFGLAIEALKNGLRVARDGWNGKGMWLSLSCNPGGDAIAGRREIAAENFWSANNSEYARQNGGSAVVLPCITMKTATGEILMGWLASQTDMLADDWQIVE